ncbi:TraB/GumN family protein [Arenicella xantha]|uniref:TraB family protein n=1 Tax=Arenicella xantha TaxID=644221 RepID=A0A395JH29_9GAMM|nr:TraB/GumN family protein [Arenicella xantha]RBP49145.1 hypothetical protein DFR28_10471 [Arenicella xantha]
MFTKAKFVTVSFVLLSLMLAVMPTADAKSPVWKVSKDGYVLYLGGTIHLLSASDYPLPEAFEIAYENADTLWFETDIAAINSLDTQAQFLQVMMYQDGSTLSQVLNRDTHKKLSDFLAERELPIAAFETVSPAGLMSTLMAIELTKLGLIDQSAGVDLHFDQRAQKDQKLKQSLESVSEQLAFLQNINELEPNHFIATFIDELAELPQVWQSLLSAWRDGNLEQLAAVGIEPMKADYPSLYEVLLVQRNNNWIDDIEKMLVTQDVEFVLVGALHMAGETGLLKQLRSAGYEVEQLD